MENSKKQKTISIVIYAILFSIIIILTTFLIWITWINDMYKEYTNPYNENCYIVEYDENSITITKYNKNNSQIYTVSKVNYENGKSIIEENKWYYKNKSIAKDIYEDMINPKDNSVTYAQNIKLNGNAVEFTYDLTSNISYDSEEVKQKVESFTTNEEIINYALEEGKENNFWFSNDYKRID